jgi:hypothetical protein
VRSLGYPRVRKWWSKDGGIDDPKSYCSAWGEFALAQIAFKPCDFIVSVQEVVEDCSGECRFPGPLRAFDQRDQGLGIVVIVEVAVCFAITLSRDERGERRCPRLWVDVWVICRRCGAEDLGHQELPCEHEWYIQDAPISDPRYPCPLPIYWKIPGLRHSSALRDRTRTPEPGR